MSELHVPTDTAIDEDWVADYSSHEHEFPLWHTRDSFFAVDAPETRNVAVIRQGLDRSGLPHEAEVDMRGVTQGGRIDIISEFGGLLVGFEVKKYSLAGPTLIADGIGQAAGYARAEVASGTWQGRYLDFVFVGPVPNARVKPYSYVPAEMLSRYTAPLGVGTFDQQMLVYAFGAEAIRFLPDGYKFCFNFDHVKKHKREFRR